MRVRATLVLTALLLAQVPWIQCHCEEVCRLDAGVQAAPCSCHEHAEEEAPPEPHGDLDHTVVMAVALASAAGPTMGAPHAVPSLLSDDRGDVALPAPSWEGALAHLDPGTGPPEILQGVRLLL